MELNELYQELIIDHGTEPRNFHALEHATHSAEGFNPLCGDKIKLYLQLENNMIKAASFTGSGCAISTASASLMTEMLVGKTVQQALAIFANFKQLVTGAEVIEDNLDKLLALAGVKAFPTRIKCATLAWHTMDAALHNQDLATTE